MTVVRWQRAAAVATLLFVAACGRGADTEADAGDGGRAAATSGTVLAQADEMFPFGSPEEMRTFADAWVRVTATAERLGEHEGEDPTEGYRSRYVTLSVDETYWVRDGIEVPAEIETITGAAVSEGVVRHMVFAGGTHAVVGGSYVAGLAVVDGRLDLVSPAALRRISGGVVQPGAGGHDDPGLPVGADPAAFVATIVGAEPLVPDTISGASARLDAWWATEG